MKKKVIEHIMAHTQQECIKRFSRNRSLIDNLGHVFNHLSDNFRLIFNTDCCYHIFINKSIKEVDFLISNDKIKVSHYTRLSLESYEDFNTLLEISQVNQRTESEIGIPELFLLTNDSYKKFATILHFEQSLNKDYLNLIIPFDFSDLDLGLFLIPNLTSIQVDAILSDDIIKTWIASIYYFLKQFLKREYNITFKGTYLPSLFSSRWHRAAILFADIRNFSVIYENLKRQHHKDYSDPKAFFLRDILNEYCREMANIIQKEASGRIDRFNGTGIIAIFGEHEDNPSKASCNAVFAATKMVKKYQQLKVDFLEKVFGNGYEIEYNENVDINISIGIDYGYNLFEYLGDSTHLEFSIIGDHVNFAILLQQETSHLPKQLKSTTPILISKTIDQCTRPWIETKFKQTISIQNNEKGYSYDVFGIDQNSFNADYYLQIFKDDSWVEAWKSYGYPIPK